MQTIYRMSEEERNKNIKQGIKKGYNMDTQHYKGIPLRLIYRASYHNNKARRFVINETNQNIWIPCKHLEDDGTIKEGENLDYIFIKASKERKLKYAGIDSWNWQNK